MPCGSDKKKLLPVVHVGRGGGGTCGVCDMRGWEGGGVGGRCGTC